MEIAPERWSLMQEQHWQMPEWWYRGKRPANDNAYFENMCRVIFQAGLNWHVIDNKWSTMRKAFADFNIDKVSCFTNADVQRLMKDAGIVRNRSKIEATIYNAQGFKAIEKTCGSFQAYLDSLDKSNNYANVIKDLTSKFKHMGPSSATLFLYTVSEKISHPWD
jgi:3-methyladenine DNA glycosylase Tag